MTQNVLLKIKGLNFDGGSGEDRFAVGEWDEEMGVPVLASAQSSLICRVADRHDFGTQACAVRP